MKRIMSKVCFSLWFFFFFFFSNFVILQNTQRAAARFSSFLIFRNDIPYAGSNIVTSSLVQRRVRVSNITKTGDDVFLNEFAE